MRPQEINRNINLAFKRFERDGRLIHFHKCKKHLENRLEVFRKNEIIEETYYLDILEEQFVMFRANAVMGRMEYISDRWNSPGRIKFILEVLKQGY